jgi:hypothetical protein
MQTYMGWTRERRVAQTMPKVLIVSLGKGQATQPTWAKEQNNCCEKLKMKRGGNMVAIDKAGAIEVVEINPEQAAAMLETMQVNRRLRHNWIEDLKGRMERGEWQEEAQDPIRFNKQGHLFDGQHRLWALIESGKSFKFLVLRGLPIETMAVFDSGRKRTVADYLRLNGVEHADSVAGSLNFLRSYEVHGEMDYSWGSVKLSPTAALSFVESHAGIADAVTICGAVVKVLGGGVSRWLAIHYILSDIDTADTAHFFSRLAQPTDLEATSPILHLRTRLSQNRQSARRMSKREHSALVFKAWNAYRKGAPMKALRWTMGGSNPEVYPTPQ